MAMTRQSAARQCNGGVVRQRVFLVGCPRSGTTLLQSILHAHRHIQSLPETHFLPHLLGSEEFRRSSADTPCSLKARRRCLGRRALAGVGLVNRRRARNAWDYLQALNVARRPPQDGGLRLSSQLAAFVDSLDEYALEAHKPMWLEKTPDHLFYIEQLQRWVPDARFIHLIRDGRQVVASLYRAAQRYPDWRPFLDLERGVDRWCTAVNESARWQGDARHLHVRYEDLVWHPEQTLQRVLIFLGCEPEAGLWSRSQHRAGELIRGNEPWKEGNLLPMQVRDGFSELLDAGQRRWVENALAMHAPGLG
ncbi:MAG: sulfotransferase [Pseudoxanthomonas sp.]